MRTSEEVAAIFKVWFPECVLFEGKNTWQKRFGTVDSVCCSEFRGGHFLEVANVLQVWDFQSMTRTLSALESVSASWSVRSGRFYCSLRLMRKDPSSKFSVQCLYKPLHSPSPYDAQKHYSHY